MSRATVEPFYEADTSTCQYVISCPTTKKAAILDSVLDYYAFGGNTYTETADKVLAYCRREKLDVQWILETHPHADHITAAPYLKQQLGGQPKIAIGEHVKDVLGFFKNVFGFNSWLKEDGSQFDYLFKDNEVFNIGQLRVRVLHTPGHTPSCVSYYIEDGDAVFVGDTLFMPDGGTARCDFPNGNASTLYRSIHGKLYKLPPQTRCFMCHDYQPGGRTPRWECTLEDQIKGNAHLTAATTEAEFIKLREARDASLGMPRYIIPGIQVNMNAGYFPPVAANGKVYLTEPINVLPAKKGAGFQSGVISESDRLARR